MFSKTGPVYEKIEKEAKMLAWGGDCYMYGLLASGNMDACFEASLSPYDFCALVPVVENAGGIITDWSGQKLTMKSDGKVVAAGDAKIHAELLRLLG
jgi:fructose-1,6-bisphosphatase/inositol monophosphatase family enzyme